MTDKARGADNLGARLAWMEDLMSQGNLLPHGISLDQIATGTGLDEILNTNSPPPSATSAAVPVPSDTASDQGIADAMDDCDDDDQGAYTTPTPVEPGPNCNSVGSIRDNCHSVATASRPEPRQTRATASHPTATALQSIGDLLHGQSPNSQRRSARAYVDAYFGDINRAYPFVDKERVLSTLSIMGDLIITSAPDYDVDAIILYLVMAIGCTTLQRTEAASDSVFTINYKDLIHRCMMQETTDTAQILLLLAIYSLFDPHGLPAAPIVDLLARQAVRLGLTRRHTANPGGHLLPAEEERAHRLFWSIYALDRTIAASTGMPAALRSINMDVPLPCITVDEFASPQRAEFISNLQVARHIIQLRILEDRVLYEIHLRDHKSTASLTREDRRSIASELQTAIENWYSSGCLLQSSELDDAAIHIRISWLASRYYNLLLLLYYPSHFNPPSISLLSPPELVSLAQKHIQAVSVRFHQRQLPLNYLTLCRSFPVCMVFMRACLGIGLDEPVVAKSEISICADILEAFPEKWSSAHRAASAVRQLLSPNASSTEGLNLSTTAATRSLSHSSPSAMSAATSAPRGAFFSESSRAWHIAIKSSLLELEEQILGRGSAFRHSEERWEDADITRQFGMSSTDPMPTWSDTPVAPAASAKAQSRVGLVNWGLYDPGSMSTGETDSLATFNPVGNFSVLDLI
ncbi:hypothetical protein FDECE_2820 [Fusarium decemcellulare]|nr:hypothetical protein FDECE_2820 [Fusarium decemcellulare]